MDIATLWSQRAGSFSRCRKLLTDPNTVCNSDCARKVSYSRLQSSMHMDRSRFALAFALRHRPVSNRRAASLTMLTILIHQAFASMDEPGGTRHYELARRLVSQGQQFTIVASDVSYHTGKRVGAKSGLVAESLEDGIRVLRVHSYAPVNKNYFLRVVSFVTFMVASVLVGVGAGKPDVIMGTTPP